MTDDTPVPHEIAALHATLTQMANDALHATCPPPTGPVNTWTARVTPPTCVHWPPNGDGQVCYYAYGARVQMGLFDGEVNSAPFARLVVDRQSDRARVEMMGALTELGIQGVRPARPEELEAWKTRADSDTLVLAMSLQHGVPTLPDAVRRFYGVWIRCNGRIAQDVAIRHPAFFDWLEGK